MADNSFKQEILAYLDRLDSDKQRQVLEFAVELARPRGETGRQFIERTRDIRIDTVDLEAMKQAIEEAFEKVDPDAWDKPIFAD